MRSKSLLLALLALTLVAGGRLTAAAPKAADLPERVIVNLTAQSATSMAVTWRTTAEHANAAVEFAVATDTAEFAKATKKVAAKAERLETDTKTVVYHYSAVLAGLTPGNHDMGYLVKDGAIVLDAKGRKERSGTVATTWRAHFTLPENGPAGSAETSYHVDYQGVRFIMINSNLKLDEPAAWLEKLLSSNPNTWTIVSFHHPLYSAGRTRDDKAARNAFLPLFDKYAVDLVLTGHDHAYARSHKLRNGQIVGPGEKGTVYVVSSSGPKTYVAQPLYQNLMAKTGEGLMLFHLIAIDGRKLTFAARTAAGNVYDSFTLSK